MLVSEDDEERSLEVSSLSLVSSVFFDAPFPVICSMALGMFQYVINMEKLYKISQDYPDWEEIIQKEGEDSENVKKVTTAYKTWNNTLESATTDNHYMFMTYCNIPNAIEHLIDVGV